MITSLYALSSSPAGVSYLSINGVPQPNTVFYRAGSNAGPSGFNMYNSSVNTFFAATTYNYVPNQQYTLQGSYKGSVIFSGSASPNASDGVFQLEFSSAGFVALNSSSDTIQWELFGTDPSQPLATDSTAVELYLFPANINNTQTLPQGMPVELLRQFVAWLEGPMGWQASTINGSLQYTSNGVGGVLADEIAAAVVLFAFNHNPPVYNRTDAKPGFYGQQFMLLQYAQAPATATCDCEDLQCVVWFLLTFLFNHSVTACFASGFGILAQNLVGTRYNDNVALCNNPVTNNGVYQDSFVVTDENTSRGFFGFHRYCIDNSAGGVIVDATLGPYAGAILPADYLGMAVDPNFKSLMISGPVTTGTRAITVAFVCTPAAQAARTGS
jgi:hypothetical protein